MVDYAAQLTQVRSTREDLRAQRVTKQQEIERLTKEAGELRAAWLAGNSKSPYEQKIKQIRAARAEEKNLLSSIQAQTRAEDRINAKRRTETLIRARQTGTLTASEQAARQSSAITQKAPQTLASTPRERVSTPETITTYTVNGVPVSEGFANLARRRQQEREATEFVRKELPVADSSLIARRALEQQAARKEYLRVRRSTQPVTDFGLRLVESATKELVDAKGNDFKESVAATKGVAGVGIAVIGSIGVDAVLQEQQKIRATPLSRVPQPSASTIGAGAFLGGIGTAATTTRPQTTIVPRISPRIATARTVVDVARTRPLTLRTNVKSTVSNVRSLSSDRPLITDTLYRTTAEARFKPQKPATQEVYTVKGNSVFRDRKGSVRVLEPPRLRTRFTEESTAPRPLSTRNPFSEPFTGPRTVTRPTLSPTFVLLPFTGSIARSFAGQTSFQGSRGLQIQSQQPMSTPIQSSFSGLSSAQASRTEQDSALRQIVSPRSVSVATSLQALSLPDTTIRTSSSTPRTPFRLPELQSGSVFGRGKGRSRSGKKPRYAPSLTGIQLGIRQRNKSPVQSPLTIRGL